MTNRALKPCPFCGGEAKTAEYDSMYLHGFEIHCVNEECHISVGTYVYPTEAEAAEAWNTRTDDYRAAADYWQRMFEETVRERKEKRND